MRGTALGLLALLALLVRAQRARRERTKSVGADAEATKPTDADWKEIGDRDVEFFLENGYLVVPGYLDALTLEALSQQVRRAVADKTKTVKSVPFRALSDAKVFKDLRDSAYTVELFGASRQLVDTVGHGFHFDAAASNVARSVATSARVARLCRALVGMSDPRVVQTKFVMKLPKIGAKVPTHADEQYIYSDQPDSAGLALWIPLDPAERSNGALQVVPRSHLEIRPGERFAEDPARGCARWAPAPTSGYDARRVGKFPYGKAEIDAMNWVLLECRAGDAVLMHSGLLHASEGNRSSKPRRAFTAHYVDGADDARWSSANWIPRPPQGFLKIG